MLHNYSARTHCFCLHFLRQVDAPVVAHTTRCGGFVVARDFRRDFLSLSGNVGGTLFESNYRTVSIVTQVFVLLLLVKVGLDSVRERQILWDSRI